LGSTLKGLELVDSIDLKVYNEDPEIVWEGLSILDYCLAPHYKSDHLESEDIDKLVDYYIQDKILFKALRDGEVEIIDGK
jgi:dipeptidase E